MLDPVWQGPSMLRVSLVATIFNVSPKTIYGWVRDARMEAVRLPGGGLRIPLSEVAAVLHMDPDDLASQIVVDNNPEAENARDDPHSK